MWTPQRVADTLVPIRDQLVDRLPREIAAARGLTRDQCELVIDEAIDYMVTEYSKPIPDRFSLDRAFWGTASFRVKRVHEGRGATVRAGWQRVDVEKVELRAHEQEPETAVVTRIERETLLEFAATLTQDERHVLACKYDGIKEQGRLVIARRLGLPASEVRRAERSIARKLERFATILAAGSLCRHREQAIFALAEGLTAGAQEEAARMHLRHCNACRIAYAAHMQAIKTGALQRRVGELLPAPAAAELAERRRQGPWEVLWDWITRPFAHETAFSMTQVATASRGIGVALTAKLAGLCLAGGAVVGGGAYCIARLGDEPPAARAAATERVTRETAPDRRPLPTAGRSGAMRQTSSASHRAQRDTRRKSSGTAFGDGPAETRHEREAPISPPATTSTGDDVREFEPAPVSAAATEPAAAPTTGAPEFP